MRHIPVLCMIRFLPARSDQGVRLTNLLEHGFKCYRSIRTERERSCLRGLRDGVRRAGQGKEDPAGARGARVPKVFVSYQALMFPCDGSRG